MKGEDKNGERFEVRCRKVVLACGQNYQKLLGVSGEEENSQDIVYDIAAMKKSLLQKDSVKQNLPVVVIGDGISAADAIIQCLKSKHNVIHVMRRSDAQLRSMKIFNLLFKIRNIFSDDAFKTERNNLSRICTSIQAYDRKRKESIV